jgi:hypothetical protein
MHPANPLADMQRHIVASVELLRQFREQGNGRIDLALLSVLDDPH